MFFIYCVSGHLFLSYLNLIPALLYVLRTLGPWQSLGILAQFLSMESLLIFPILTG